MRDMKMYQNYVENDIQNSTKSDVKYMRKPCAEKSWNKHRKYLQNVTQKGTENAPKPQKRAGAAAHPAVQGGILSKSWSRAEKSCKKSKITAKCKPKGCRKRAKTSKTGRAARRGTVQGGILSKSWPHHRFFPQVNKMTPKNVPRRYGNHT